MEVPGPLHYEYAFSSARKGNRTDISIFEKIEMVFSKTGMVWKVARKFAAKLR